MEKPDNSAAACFHAARVTGFLFFFFDISDAGGAARGLSEGGRKLAEGAARTGKGTGG